MFGLIDSFSFIWDLNDQPAQTEDCDKEVEDLSPYNEGTGEGSSASQASYSVHLCEWDISRDYSLEILDIKPAFKYQKVQHAGSDSSDSEGKESIEKNSHISKKSIQRVS